MQDEYFVYEPRIVNLTGKHLVLLDQDEMKVEVEYFGETIQYEPMYFNVGLFNSIPVYCLDSRNAKVERRWIIGRLNEIAHELKASMRNPILFVLPDESYRELRLKGRIWYASAPCDVVVETKEKIVARGLVLI